MLIRKFSDWFTGRSAAVEKALQGVGWVYACNSKLSDAASLLSFSYFDKHTGESLTLDPDPLHVFQDAITGEYLDHGEILSRIVSNIGYFGRSGALIENMNKSDHNRPSLVRLYPGHMITRDRDTGKWKVGEETITDASSLILWMNYHPSFSEVGVPPFFFARLSLEELYYIHRWNQNFFRSGMRPDVIIRVPQRLTSKQRREMRKELLEEFAGVDKGNSFFIISGLRDAEVQLSSRSEKDIDFKEGKEFTREEICTVYGVPPALVGIFRYANYANSSAQMRIFWYTTVLPKVHRILGTFQRRYFDRYWPNVEVRLDSGMAGLMLMDVREMSEAASRLIQSGYMYDEVAEILNYPSLAVGRSVLLPGSSPAPESGPSVGGSGTAEIEPNEPAAEEPEPAEPATESSSAFWEDPSRPSFLRTRILAPSQLDGFIEVAYSRGYVEDYVRLYQMIIERNTTALSRVLRHWGQEVIADLLKNFSRSRIVEVNEFLWQDVFEKEVAPLVQEQYLDAVLRVYEELQDVRKSVTFDLRFKRPQLTSYLTNEQLHAIQQDINALTSHLKGVSAHVIETARRIAQRAVQDGLTVAEIREHLLKKTALGDPARATTWARDISGTIYNRARFSGFQARGVTHHRWVNSGDEHVRDSHRREASSEPVLIGEPFPITHCRYPRDPQGPVGETVNCRCTTVAVLVRRLESTPQDPPRPPRHRPVTQDDEVIKLRKSLEERLGLYMFMDEDAIKALQLENLSLKALQTLDDILNDYEDYLKTTASGRPERIVAVKMEEENVERFRSALQGDIDAFGRYIHGTPASSREPFQGIFRGEPIKELGLDPDEVYRGLTGVYSWVGTTAMGNTLNGRAIMYVERLWREAEELINKGLFFKPMKDEYTDRMMAPYYGAFLRDLEDFRAHSKDATRVLIDRQEAYRKCIKEGGGGAEIYAIREELELIPGGEKTLDENLYVVRYTRADRLFRNNRPADALQEIRPNDVLDQGYSPAGPFGMTWIGNTKVVYLIPKDKAGKFFEENLAFYKVGNKIALDPALKARGAQFFAESEEEVVFKGRFRVVRAVVNKDGDKLYVYVKPEGI